MSEQGKVNEVLAQVLKNLCEELRKVKKDRNAFQTQAGARKREIFLLKQSIENSKIPKKFKINWVATDTTSYYQGISEITKEVYSIYEKCNSIIDQCSLVITKINQDKKTMRNKLLSRLSVAYKTEDRLKKEYAKEALELKAILPLIKELFSMLDTEEESNEESKFRPTTINTCRVLHTIKLKEILPKIRRLIK